MSFFGGILGGLAGGALDLFGAERRNASAQSVAREQMAFQERMYKSRYQMQMADMRKAGLNPMLSFMQSPGSSPTGAMSNPINSMQGLGRSVSEAVGRGTQAALQVATAKQAEAQVEKTKAETANVEADTALKGDELQHIRPEQRSKLMAEAEAQHSAAAVNRAKEKLTILDTTLREADIDVRQKDALIAGIEAKVWSSGPGEIIKMLSTMGVNPKTAQEVGRAAWAFMSAIRGPRGRR